MKSILVGCVAVLSFLGMSVQAQCPSMDVTGDCYVDLADFAVVAGWWLEDCDMSNTWCSGADVDQSGSVNIEDLTAIVSLWQTGFRLPGNLVLIPTGTFLMGNSSGEGACEYPAHTVTLDSFYMGKYEITNGQYCAFLNSAYPSQLRVVDGIVYASNDTEAQFHYCDTSTSSLFSQIAFTNNSFSVCTKGGRDMSNDPMVCVSWYGAVAYCNWRSQQEGKQTCYNLSTWICDFNKKGYRLPTEAEWEYAARGGLRGMRFPWGDTISHSQANYNSDGSPNYDISPTRGYHPDWNDGIPCFSNGFAFFQHIHHPTWSRYRPDFIIFDIKCWYFFGARPIDNMDLIIFPVNISIRPKQVQSFSQPQPSSKHNSQ